MTATGFQEVFDASSLGNDRLLDVLWVWLLPLVGLAIFLFKDHIEKFSYHSWTYIRGFSILFIAICLPLAALITYSTHSQNAEWKRKIDEGQTKFVGGCLDYFHPMPAQGHETEIVAVQGEVFRYSDYNLTTPFNNTRSHNGPIGPRTEVRIWFSGNDILRLQARDGACPAAPDPGENGPPASYGSDASRSTSRQPMSRRQKPSAKLIASTAR